MKQRIWTSYGFWNFENVRQVYEQFNALKMKELWVTLVSIIKHFVNNVHSWFLKSYLMFWTKITQKNVVFIVILAHNFNCDSGNGQHLFIS